MGGRRTAILAGTVKFYCQYSDNSKFSGTCVNGTDHSQELEQLSLSPWFMSLPEALKTQILQRSVVRSFRRGEFLVREGGPPRGLYGLMHGRTRHVRSVGDGDEVLVHVGEPGIWFGEFPLLSGQPSVGSIIADAAVRALFLPVGEFQRIVEDEPRYYREFNRLMWERYALLFRFMAEAQGLAPEAWLRSRLVGVAEVQRGERPLNGPATIAMSQTDLANMIGMSRQTLNMLLARLQARGMVEVGYRSIRLLG
jgi:CRP-like cAMP-binding protein